MMRFMPFLEVLASERMSRRMKLKDLLKHGTELKIVLLFVI